MDGKNNSNADVVDDAQDDHFMTPHFYNTIKSLKMFVSKVINTFRGSWVTLICKVRFIGSCTTQTEVQRIPSVTQLGFEPMTFRSWTAHLMFLSQ